MTFKPWLAALALASSAAFAQAPPAPASTPAKKALVAKVLQLQQPAIETMARLMAERPAQALLQQAGIAIQQRVPQEKRAELARTLQADARKYADEVTPALRDRAVKLAPSTIGVVLEERFTEEELKQLVAILESPVNKKFQLAAGDMQKSLGEKLVAETQATVEPKVKALEQQFVQRLNAAIGQPAGAASAPK